MKRSLITVCALASLAFAVPAFAESNVAFSLSISNAPPPPVVVYRAEPHWVYVPENRVYVVDEDNVGYDYFRYGSFFYIYDNGYWYRSARYRGPFMAIRADYVPRPIYAVGDNGYHWRHHPQWMPPGQAKKMWREEAASNHGNGHGNGHGHGNGKGHDHDGD